jgi:hypothetical protein
MANQPHVPISLSDIAMNQLVQWLRPLVPMARHAFMQELAAELRQEIEQPPGDGAVFRIARALLRTGQFQKAGEYIVNDGTRNFGAHAGGYRPRAKRG